MGPGDFSNKSREESIRLFGEESFDLLIVGGGITGAATARDAVSRGLKVALVERSDFASGTSSRSSKLIHGGLRYLENFEMGLVFEALHERAFLLKAVPTMVRPLPFYWPVYEGDPHGRAALSLGLWLYDLLALFRAPGFHKRLSKKALLKELPYLKPEGLKGGFRYYDASMWDDALAVATLRSAHQGGARIANYVEAIAPLWTGDRITGFRVRDLEGRGGGTSPEIDIRAQQVIVCAGPWTDRVGAGLSGNWKNWLTPSKGVHLVFDLKRFSIPGALVMSHPKDGRISFVIPRADLGAGVVIVGTTDGPSGTDPGSVAVDATDVEYLMELLHRYFPGLKLTPSDILSAYVGVRPLVGPGVASAAGGVSLQKVSREHHIDQGPGGTVVVAGGKYTTHRQMAKQIVDFAVKLRAAGSGQGKHSPLPAGLRPSNTGSPVNLAATGEAIEKCRTEALRGNTPLPEELLARYGAEAAGIAEMKNQSLSTRADPAGFPFLAAQLRHAIRSEMVMHLEDFYFRRVPLFLSRADHGLPWAEELSKVWAEERGLPPSAAVVELARLQRVVQAQASWRESVSLE